MIKKLLFLALFCRCFSLSAQTIKTDVLIVGAGPGGVAAAIQCARSNVKTALAIENTHLINYPSNQKELIQNNLTIHSGIWGELRDSLATHYSNMPGIDTTQNKPVRFEPNVAEDIFKKISDSAKNLTVYQNTNITSIKKDGDRWELSVAKNGKVSKFVARVIIDATDGGTLITMLGLKSKKDFNALNQSHPFLYRTSIAAGIGLSGKIKEGKPGAWRIPLNAVIVKDTVNVLNTELMPGGSKDVEFLPFQLEVGQAAGATAAFCAFYKTTTKKMRVRFIQSELMNFKAYLLPFTDVAQGDPNWRAIQQIAVTGLLNGVEANGQFLFKPDSLVNTIEVKPVLIETYTRAFLWFGREKPSEKFTLGNLLSFISDYALTDPELLNSTVQKAWKNQYHFKQNFDLKRQVTRLEFAVLANKYLNPFARTIDLDGKLVN